MTEKQQAQNTGQGSFPAPKQMEHPENDNSHSFSVNRPDGFGLRGVDSENRKAEVKLDDMATMDNRRNDRSFLSGDSGDTLDGGMTNEQNTATNFDLGRNPADPGNRGNSGSSNRADDEVKNGQLVRKESFVVQGSFLGNGGIRSDRFDNQGDSEIAQSARLSAPAKLAAFDAGNATKKQASAVAQMPQSNATKNNLQSIEFARPSGWGKLWRLVQNGNYYYYELRFINEDRVRQKGGKITPAIARKLAARKGKGRHKESRKDAERFRGAAEHLASRLRAVS